jgi:hypothetical protein
MGRGWFSLERRGLEPGLLKAETLDLLFTSQKTTAGEATGYGIGWFITKDSLGHRWVFHGGSSIGGTALRSGPGLAGRHRDLVESQ